MRVGERAGVGATVGATTVVGVTTVGVDQLGLTVGVVTTVVGGLPFGLLDIFYVGSCEYYAKGN